MAKHETHTTGGAIVGVLMAASAANLLSGQLLHYPFVYCWLKDVATTLYIGCATVILYTLMLYIVYSLLRMSIPGILYGAAGYTAAVELPRVAVYLFNTGGSCG